MYFELKISQNIILNSCFNAFQVECVAYVRPYAVPANGLHFEFKYVNTHDANREK